MNNIGISKLTVKDEPPFLATFALDYGDIQLPDWTLWISNRGPYIAYARAPQGKSGKWVVICSGLFQEQVARAAINAYNAQTGGRSTFLPLPSKTA